MLDEEKTQMQDADLHTKERVVRVKLPALPNNPYLVVAAQGRYFVPNDPVLGFGRVLQYHEVDVFRLGGSDA